LADGPISTVLLIATVTPFDFMLSKQRNTAAALRSFKRSIASRGAPNRFVIDKSGADLGGPTRTNAILKVVGTSNRIKVRQVECLKNVL
jgi:putative transposase